MSETQHFHIGTILTVTHDRLLAPNGMEDMYKILNFMTGDNLYTHQLPRAARECTPHLLRQHPELANLNLDDVTPDNWKACLEGLSSQFGETLEVSTIPPEDHEWIDPVSEIVEKVHPDKIIVLEKS